MTESDPLERLVPGLGALSFPDEGLATCAQCAMGARPLAREGAVTFTAAARCCTYHPTLPNWLVGRALRRGGEGAERVRARLDDPDGRDAMALGPGAARATAWRQRSDTAFGRDEALTCPLWAPGPLGCTIHADRNAVCRTWFCKVERGARGTAAWMALKTLRTDAEHRLAERCVTDGSPPTSDAPPREWDAWYRWCADHVDALPDAALAGARLDTLRGRVHAATSRRDAPMPAILTPVVHDWVTLPDSVLLSSWSPYDRVEAPRWIFTLLSKLDGQRTWREAADLAATELDQAIPDGWVWHLWSRGLLEAPTDPDAPEHPIIDVLPA